MKKTLLNLGALSLLAVTPIVALASCGGTTDTKLTITTNYKTQAEVDAAIVVLNTEASTDEQKVTALNTIFTGVTIENFKNFKTVAVATVDTTMGKITLTANEGFSFDGSKTIESKVMTILTVSIPTTEVTQNHIDAAIVVLNTEASTDEQKVTALNTIFTGVTIENFKNFKTVAVATVDTTMGKITLTANEGFLFGTSETLESKVVTVTVS